MKLRALMPALVATIVALTVLGAPTEALAAPDMKAAPTRAALRATTLSPASGFIVPITVTASGPRRKVTLQVRVTVPVTVRAVAPARRGYKAAHTAAVTLRPTKSGKVVRSSRVTKCVTRPTAAGSDPSWTIDFTTYLSTGEWLPVYGWTQYVMPTVERIQVNGVWYRVDLDAYAACGVN
jgi:hypothetical protein